MQSSALYSKSRNQKRCKSLVGPRRNSNVIQMRSRVLGCILDARQDRAAGSCGVRRMKIFKSSRAEIRIRIDVSSDTCLRIENRYAVRRERGGRCADRVDEEKIFKFHHKPDVTRAAFVARRLNEWFIYGARWMCERERENERAPRYKTIRQTFYITYFCFTCDVRFIWLSPLEIPFVKIDFLRFVI